MGSQSINIPVLRTTREAKVRLQTFIGALPPDAIYEIHINPKRATRTLRQNAWYWAGIVTPFAEFLRAQDYDMPDLESVGGLLRARFLAVTVFNPNTGEAIGRRVRSTTELSSEEMADYCERCRAWLLDQFGIVTLDPAEYLSSFETSKQPTGAKV